MDILCWNFLAVGWVELANKIQLFCAKKNIFLSFGDIHFSNAWAFQINLVPMNYWRKTVLENMDYWQKESESEKYVGCFKVPLGSLGLIRECSLSLHSVQSEGFNSFMNTIEPRFGKLFHRAWQIDSNLISTKQRASDFMNNELLAMRKCTYPLPKV